MKFLKFRSRLTVLQSSRLTVLQSSRPTVLQSSRLIVLLILLISSSLRAQNEANVWYFGLHCGLDFSTGTPVALHDGGTQTYWEAYSTICDSSGKLLFYMDYTYVFDKNHYIMQNGSGMGHTGPAGRAIVKWPGQKGMYYIFSTGAPDHDFFAYSIVDLNLNNGSGAITENNVPVDAVPEGTYLVATAKQENSDNVWVVTRKFINSSIAAFLVDENGFNPNPVISKMPDRDTLYSNGAWFMKISYDKKYIVITNQGSGEPDGPEFEVCRFNALTGESAFMYSYYDPFWMAPCGIEFSPDSKYLYIHSYEVGGTNKIYQLDMSLIEDSVLFENSAILVGSGHAWGLQLARDGKIYCGNWLDYPYYFMDVISKPWIRGTSCSFEMCPVSLYPGNIEGTFNNILVDYLLRFEWEGEQCQSYPIQFKPNFIPTPDSITWYFDEFAPGSLTHELYPVYAFQNAGIHEITVDVWYPDGRYEHTSREIEIFPTPVPDLGPDILICEGSSDTLYANCEADFYSWNGLPGGPQYIVSDTGAYRIMATAAGSNCHGTDTIHVGFYPTTVIDETNLLITPTTCNGASGSITGLTAIGTQPLVYRWVDLSEVEYGTAIDVFNLPAGQYRLTITDGNGCETNSDIYTIKDAGNLQVLDVELTQPHCGRPDGKIVVHASSPSGSSLEYSINDGTDYSTDSLFSGLLAGTYVIRIRDVNGCEGFYLSNPVILTDIPGPQVIQVNVTNETDGLGNGAIEIVASGSTTQLFYSIDSGNTWQINNGSFEDVLCGMYYVLIKDENGCDTSFVVEVQNIILTYLHAVTGEGGHCLGYTAMVPVNVDNFNAVANFHLKLSYNKDNLQCEGFANVQAQMVDSLIGWVDQGAGEIHLAWNSPTSVTFTGTEKVTDLVFTTKNPGQGQLSWYTGATESYFTNASGNPIPAQFQTGEVTIYEPPEIFLEQSKTVCTGQFVSIMGIAVGNQPPFDYLWIKPNGDTTMYDPVFFNVSASDAGLYTLIATDHVGCKDQKTIELIVSENPVAAFHGVDTLEIHAGEVLDAGAGLVSYHWNTGDTTESIVISTDGKYAVEMESPFGCTGRDSIYVKLASGETPSQYIFIPNAFSPNGDGLNDVFQIVADASRIYSLQFRIYDRWGGEVFESKGIDNGWDGTKNGKLLPGGIYAYKITYSIYPSLGDYSEQVRLGTVMLVR